MFVGVLFMRLSLPGVRSLKEKRRVLSRIKERTRSRFNVAVAEVEHLDTWQSAGLGFTVVGNDAAKANSALDQILNFVESLGLADVQDQSMEILSVRDD